MPFRRKMIVGNWKMNVPADPAAAIDVIAEASVSNLRNAPALVVCPPATMVALLVGRGIRVGGQDCHIKPSGAYTGDISAPMLALAGASHVIVGHSERRIGHFENDQIVARKTLAAWRSDLTAIVCVGETKADRDGGGAAEAVAKQVAGSLPKGVKASNTVVAYEPVWAIGAGTAATPEQIAEMHAVIRKQIASAFGDRVASNIRILYGGSVTAENAAAIFAHEDVDGALIGGASLRADEFLSIAARAQEAMA